MVLTCLEVLGMVSLISLETFATVYCPLTSSDAKHFIGIFERHFQKCHESQAFDEIRRRMTTWLTDLPEEREWYEDMRQRLQDVIDRAFVDSDGFFAKTSSRSAKDACVFREEFFNLYQRQLSTFPDPKQENAKITALLVAAFLSLRMTCASDVLSVFVISERIYQDMLLATEVHARNQTPFTENIILRPFVPIDVDMEFRGFVFQRRLTCLSQYNYLIHSQRLCQGKDSIGEKISSFFNETVREKLKDYRSDNYVIDFALAKTGECLFSRASNLVLLNGILADEGLDGMRVWVIELNPFMETTDGALFSWEHERHLLERRVNDNPSSVLFRVTEKERPGSWAMLPNSIRQWIPKSSRA